MEDAILVVTDPPSSLEFGIDCMSFDTGPQFRGVSVIPTGLHLIYHSTGMGSRQGFFLESKKNDIIVTSWDPSTEEITVQPQMTEVAAESLRAAVRRGELNANLGPYPLSQHTNWINLSGLITHSVLKRADVPCGTLIYPGECDDTVSLASPSIASIKPYFPGLARIARFAPIQELERVFTHGVSTREGVTGGEISHYQMDKSSFLRSLVRDYFDASYEDLLGELQLSFLLFMVLYSYPALEHWKRLMNVLCQCEEVIMNQPSFYAAFLRLAYEQLNYSPDDFFNTELSRDNFLRPIMTSLFQILSSEKLPPPLCEHRRRLLTFMRKKFNLFEDSSISGYIGEEDVPSHLLPHVVPSLDEMFNLVDEDRPVIVYMNDTDKTAEDIGSKYDQNDVSMSPLDPKQLEIQKFGWRYPYLFGHMSESEDMVMAAVRLIESSHDNADIEEDKDLRHAVQEARLFIENEVPLLASGDL